MLLRLLEYNILFKRFVRVQLEQMSMIKHVVHDLFHRIFGLPIVRCLRARELAIDTSFNCCIHRKLGLCFFGHQSLPFLFPRTNDWEQPQVHTQYVYCVTYDICGDFKLCPFVTLRYIFLLTCISRGSLYA